MNKKPLIFTGSAHPAFARRLADFLKTRVGRLQIGKYPNGEIRVRVKEEIKDKTAVVVQTLSVPAETHLLEFSLLVDALKRLHPRKVIGVIPWLAYSLQDEQFLPGEPISAKLIANFLDTLKLQTLVLVDVHSKRLAAYFQTPLRVISQPEIVGTDIEKRLTNNTIIVAPDEGAKDRVSQIASLTKRRMLTLQKTRDRYSGKIEYARLQQDVSGMDCIICDDVVITGNTLIMATHLLKQNGAKSIVVYCTHVLAVPGSMLRLFQSPISEFVVTDTLPIGKYKQFNKLKTISTIPAVGNAIAQIQKE